MLMPSIFGENLFDDFMDFPFGGKKINTMMKTDIRDTDSSYELDIDMPGFKKEDIKAQLKDGYLTISASTSANNDEQDKDGRYIRRERYYGSSSRSFYVGDLRPEEIKCKYESGVLSITVPKKAQQELPASTRIAIE